MELLTVGILLVDLFCSLIHRKLTFNSMRMRQQQKIGFGNTEEQIVELACEKFERLIVGHPVRYLLGIPSVHCTLQIWAIFRFFFQNTTWAENEDFNLKISCR